MSAETTLVEGISDADIAAEAKAIAKIKAVPTPPIDGVTVKLCGVDAVVPPLKAKHLRKFGENMEKFRTASPDTPVATVLEITIPFIHAALCRNYPTLTSEDVFELLDTRVFPVVVQAVMAQSGYRAAQPGE